MTRKIALWAVARPMSCGVRTNLRTVRPATATVLGQNLAPGLTRLRAGLSGEPVITDVPTMAILSVQAAAGPLGWPAVLAGLAVRVRKTSSSVGRRSEM